MYWNKFEQTVWIIYFNGSSKNGSPIYFGLLISLDYKCEEIRGHIVLQGIIRGDQMFQFTILFFFIVVKGSQIQTHPEHKHLDSRGEIGIWEIHSKPVS
jgi:hypothetical protein